MKKTLSAFVFAILFSLSLFAQTHQRRCGIEECYDAMIGKDSSLVQKYKDQRASLQAIADYYIQNKKNAQDQRTTQTWGVPIVFHIIVDSAQFKSIGGTAGIIQRCDSQIAVLNRDFNKMNYDSVLIPSGWKDSLYGNPGIQFGLAHVDPNGFCTPGFEVLIIPGDSLNDAGYNDSYDAFLQAKTPGIGLSSWDVSRYYNVWCFNINGYASYLLGVTVPKSMTTGSGGFSPGEMGVVLQYNTLGSTGPTNIPPAGTGDSTGWLFPYNLGRPLTHMTGHFFEIWHTWGDDNGKCPWNQTGTSCMAGYGFDDGLSDTPPESDVTTGNPVYAIPGGTINDCCMMHDTANAQSIGIACLSYMDGTDDVAMHLFTPMQAAAMAAMVLIPPVTDSVGLTGKGMIGENYNLIQHPDLLGSPCFYAGITSVSSKNNFNIYPSPASGEVNISINSAEETLNEIIVINMLGQQVKTVKGNNVDYYSIDLSGMSKGIYFVKCNFASGSVTRKILLQ